MFIGFWVLGCGLLWGTISLLSTKLRQIEQSKHGERKGPWDLEQVGGRSWSILQTNGRSLLGNLKEDFEQWGHVN